jgi:hypothetical protein
MFREEPERFRGIQQAAVRRIDQKHTWQQVMDAYRALYQQALTLIE